MVRGLIQLPNNCFQTDFPRIHNPYDTKSIAKGPLRNVSGDVILSYGMTGNRNQSGATPKEWAIGKTTIIETFPWSGGPHFHLLQQ